jgi:ABC-type branched-subunit amino acid transport system permease subunit
VAAVTAPSIVHSTYHLNVLINALMFTVLAMSLNVVYGYAGLLSFAQVGFWGIGGYAAALTVLKLDGSVWQGIAVASVLCSGLAVAIGAVALRLSNHAFVIVSIAFTLLAQMLAQEWIELTNGPMGLPGLPPPAIPVSERCCLIDSPTRFYYLTLSFAVLSLGLMWLVLSSRIGRTLRMIRHDESLARSLGVRVTRWKLFATGFAAAFAGMAGAIYVFYLTIVDPLIFDIYYTQLVLVIVIIGGLGTFWPVIAAGLLLTVLPELLRTPNEIRMIAYGVVLIGTVLLLPNGLAGLAATLSSSRARRVAGHPVAKATTHG